MTAPALPSATMNLLDDPAFFHCDRLHATMKKTVCVDRQMQSAAVENGELSPRQLPDMTKRLWLSHCADCEMGKQNKKEVERMSKAIEPRELAALTPTHSQESNDLESVKVKTCAKCGMEKPLEDFHKDNACKDGLKSMCKICLRKYQRDLKKRKNKKQKPKKARKPMAPAAKPTGKPTLVLIGGLPGSGKTTLAQKEFVPKGFFHFESDHVFTDCGGRYRFNAQIWPQVREMVFTLADVALSRGDDVVVCDLFHREQDIDLYRNLAAYHRAGIQVIHCDGQQQSVHPVPLTVMRRLEKEADGNHGRGA